MSFKTYLFRSAMRKSDEAELRTFFNFVALPNQQFTQTLFQDWVFEMPDGVDRWEAAVGASDYQTLHEFISEFEDKIIHNFLKAASDNTIYLDDRITDDDEMDRLLYFRSLICSMYMYIYGEYVNTIFRDFDPISKRVYQEVFDDEPDEGCDDPLSD